MSSSLDTGVTGRHVLIAQRLRQRRDELGLTQKQIVTRLARCGLRTTNRALSSLEHGSGLDVGKLPELAIALDCTITYLVGLTDDPHRWTPDTNGEQRPSARPARTPRPQRTAPPTPAPSLILGEELPERTLGTADPAAQ